MSPNPYQAPKAELADTSDVLPPRPRAVSAALGLVLGGVLVQFLSNVYILQQHEFRFEHPLASMVNAGGFVLLVFLCHQMARRRGWPRFVLLVVTLLAFLQMCLAIGAARRYLTSDEVLEGLPRFVVMQVVPVAMHLAALHLLFFSSGDWFRRPDVR